MEEVMSETPKVGESAPGFELPDSTGETCTLDDLVGTGPVVLIFFRGPW